MHHSSDDGSLEPKRYSVDFSINLSFYLDYFVINFSLHIYILLDILFKNENGEIITDVYHKPTDTQQYLHFNSHHQKKKKMLKIHPLYPSTKNL